LDVFASGVLVYSYITVRAAGASFPFAVLRR
jgi:hypothetical protein